MIIEFEIDRTGCLLMTPVSKRWNQKIVSFLKGFKIEREDGSAFIQQDTNMESALSRHCSKAEQKDLWEGWTVKKNIDPWTFLHYIGYDAHTLAE